jgi:hypothetical protein
MLHECHVIYSVRYYPQFHVNGRSWNILPVDTGALLYAVKITQSFRQLGVPLLLFFMCCPQQHVLPFAVKNFDAHAVE